jgi:cysteine-rich repeat protein
MNWKIISSGVLLLGGVILTSCGDGDLQRVPVQRSVPNGRGPDAGTIGAGDLDSGTLQSHHQTQHQSLDAGHPSNSDPGHISLDGTDAASTNPGDGDVDSGSSSSGALDSGLSPIVIETVVAVSGGTVQTQGATLQIPGDSLTGDTEITLEVSEATAGLPAFTTLTGVIYDFGPDGTTFDPPATLTLALGRALAPGERAVISWLDEGSNLWIDIDSQLVDSTISAQVAHFTTFAPRIESIESVEDAGVSVAICGNNAIEGTEQCDDGDTSSNDGCSATCQLEYCGDNQTQDGIGEECDDGDASGNDGCSATCQQEYCGDNQTQDGIGEECDDGNTNSNDGCSATCQQEYCGDNQTQTGIGEECDDGNTSSGDGCTNACQKETGCGNGAIDDPPAPAEQCDDDNIFSGDGCSATCHTEYCGDNTVQPGLGEQCDDGGTVSGDGCSSTCHTEQICGNGVREGTEQCDDGNINNNDGCSSTCHLEF